MKETSRRDFLKLSAMVGATAVGVGATSSQKANASPALLNEDRMGVLVDTTVCVGCRNCEWACKTVHGKPTKELDSYEDRAIFDKFRRPDHTGHTVVNEYPATGEYNIPVDVKVQCMHCDHPACASACIVGAFTKTELGAVIWDTKKCIGCRYCMVACPFQIPTFEYHEAIQPNIDKCDFCYERTQDGLLPGCVDICPVEALTYGRRSELINVARHRIAQNPERYVNHIYGENEVGGTSWLYLAPVEFDKLDFPILKKNPAPGVSEAIQHGIFSYFVPPAAFYALLGGMMWLTKRDKQRKEEEA